MATLSREFQVFAKPVGPLCNLRCNYCYYLGKKNLYKGKDQYLMPDDILEKYIIQHIEATTETEISFSWHGGEPLMAGIDFFRKVIGYQKKHQPPGSVITNGIQTNGTLINAEWARFLTANGFVVGISIDGPAEFHNWHRKASNYEGTFRRVVIGYELLRKHGLLPEVLCVVNAENVRHPIDVYELFRKLGAEFITFIPLVEPEPFSPNGVSIRSVPSGEFGVFLSAIFDEWVEKDIGRVKIQIFEEAARTAFNQDHSLCIFKTNCGGVPVIEHNGDFYSCDHYVSKEYLVGNIKDHTLAAMLDSSFQAAFGEAKSLTLPRYCLECEVKNMCNGECPKNRFISTPDGEPGLNYLCSGYKYFFSHCRPFVEAIREAWLKKK